MVQEPLTEQMSVHIIFQMNEEYLKLVKNTVLVILKEREFPEEIGFLGLVVDWEPLSIENDNYYDERSLWELNLYLPAHTYAKMNADRLSKSADIIKATLNEITRPQRDHFVSVSFHPALVEELTFTQEELIEWLKEALPATHQLAANN